MALNDILKLLMCNFQPGIFRSFEKANLKHFYYASSIAEAIDRIRGENCKEVTDFITHLTLL
jgi:hypothetical protein